jgi:flagellar basal body P-ring formation protein FlgA
MTDKRLTNSSLLLVIGLCLVWTGRMAAASQIQIHLPREAKITDSTIRLKDIGILRGDKALVVTASNISLGRLFIPHQKMTIERTIILSRLASHGIRVADVDFSGAKTVTVQQDQQAIDGQELVDIALSYLHKHLGDRYTTQITPSRLPKALYLGTTHKDIQLTPTFSRKNNWGYAQVTITALSQGTPLATREIAFRIQYQCTHVSAKNDIEPGAKITRDNITLGTHYASRPQSPPWKPPYGQTARIAIKQGKKITASLLTVPTVTVSLQRKAKVLIRIKRPGLMISTTGITESSGITGAIIKVKNVDSGRIIHCRIMNDGTVEPII